MAQSSLMIRKLVGVVAIAAVVLVLGKAFVDSISIPPIAKTPLAISETRYRIYLFAKLNGELPKRLVELPERSGYANTTVDFWGRELIYKIDKTGTMTLGSYGRDGKIGGTGEDADILHRYKSRDETGRFIAGDEMWVVEGGIYVENDG